MKEEGRRVNNFKILEEKINKKKAQICIIGLGYVGLPLAVFFAKKGYRVYGLDNNVSRINKLKKGKQYIVDVDSKDVTTLINKKKFFPTLTSEVLKRSDVVIICVPTPLRRVKTPDISYIINASRTIKKYLHQGQLIVLESTTYPGTSREIILPTLKQTGLNEEEDFYLSFSPERVDPGNKKYPLNKIPKIVGGIGRKSTELTKNLYSKIIKQIHPVSSIETAETVKLLENTFRLVNIGLINEFAIVAEKLGVNVWEVIEGAKTKPFGFMPFYPGPGCGGHCLPCDPLYLSWKAKKLGFKTKMIDLASFTNHFMPEYVVERVERMLNKNSAVFNKIKILILGVTYKKDVKDLRESPALDIIEKFTQKKVKVDYSDPLIPYLKINDINLKSVSLSRSNLQKYDCVIIVANHSSINYDFLRKSAKLIFDTRNAYPKDYSNIVRL